MSAEALRQITIERVNREIDQQLAYLTETTDQPIDAVRLTQGVIKGLKLAIDLQNAAYKGMS